MFEPMTVRDGVLIARDLRRGRKLPVGGQFATTVRRHALVQDAIERGDPEREAWMRRYVRALGAVKAGRDYVTVGQQTHHNVVPNGGMNFLLNLLFRSRAKISTWYVGVFTDDVTPDSTWKSNWAGASSGPKARELPDAAYDEAGRRPLDFDADASGQLIESNDVTFTLASGQAGVDAHGFTVNSVATVGYNAVDQILWAATRFDEDGIGSSKLGLSSGDTLSTKYRLGLQAVL